MTTLVKPGIVPPMDPATNSSAFKFYAEKITGMVLEEGISFRPFGNPSLLYFSMLSENEQSQVIRDLTTYFRICSAVKLTGGSLKDTRLLTEVALKEFGFQMNPSDLDLIEPHHLIEIYNLSQMQIFRSFRFFELSSYTLEDLYCRKWYHLYERNEDDHIATAERVAEFYQNPVATKLNFTEHFIKEKETLERLNVASQLLWLVPTFQNKTFNGMMVIEAARPVPHY